MVTYELSYITILTINTMDKNPSSETDYRLTGQ